MNKSASLFIGACVIACLTMIASAGLPTHPMVLEISTRPWLYKLSKNYGRQITSLRDIPMEEFQKYRQMGFDIIWMMGVWRLGEYGVKHDRNDPDLVATFKQLLPDYTPDDAIGSPYAPIGYTCNPTLCPNGDSDLQWLRDKLHALGLYLMLDFVPNHSGCDSPWMDGDGINLYVRAPQGTSDPSKYMDNGVAYGNCPYSSPWTDVAQLNYWNPDLRSHMTQQLLYVASLADGIRCDMAYIDLNEPFGQTWATELAAWGWKKPSTEFWGDAIKTVKAKYPSVVFLAEVYGDYYKTLQQLGFDYTYDKEYLDRLKSGNMDSIHSWLSDTESCMKHMCYFTENHDEDRSLAVFGGDAQRTAGSAVMAMSLPGLRFFFEGQELGLKNKLDVHLRRARDESGDAMLKAFYPNFTKIMSSNVMRDGTWARVSLSGDESWKFVAWSYTLSSEKEARLVVVNYGAEKSSCQVIVPDVVGSGNVAITELLSGITYQRSAPEMRSTGLTVIIDAHSAQIFTYPRA